MQDKSLWKKQYTMFDLEELSDDIWYFKNSVKAEKEAGGVKLFRRVFKQVSFCSILFRDL